MTDRVNALVVVLEKDIRIDDVESLRKAIRHMRGVRSVDVNVTELADHVAYVQIRQEFREQFSKWLREWD